MADDPNKSGSWWTTMPGVLTAAAAVITAVTGLVAILSQTGVFGEKSKSFVSQKAGDVRDAVSPSQLAVAPTTQAPKVADPKAVDARTPSTPDPSPVVDKPDAASGVVSTPLHAAAFKGAIVTLNDGTVVKLRDHIRDPCQAQVVLKTQSGQLIELERMRRFDLSDWNGTDHMGTAHVTLNNGETMDVRVEGCAITGSNDLGDYRSDFANVRSVEFIR